MADDIGKSQDYGEILNAAMAIHAENAIKGLQFNRTELAEVTDITNRDRGEYQVFNGSARYFAYSENTSYTLGTKVYVNIPNNDYSQQKTIIGRYVDDSDTKGINYVSPWETFNNNGPDLFEQTSWYKNYNNNEGLGLIVNYNKETTEYPKEQVYLIYETPDLVGNEDYQGYSYLGISADFKTKLKSYYPIAGSYGLLAEIDYVYNVTNEQSSEYLTKFCKLDSSNMVGSIYNFNTYYNQQAVFKLDQSDGKTVTIKKVKVYFYQGGNFKDNENNLISPFFANNQLVDDNLLVRNIIMQFGTDAEVAKKDNIVLYTLNGLTYDSAQTNDKLNEKRINLRWNHLDSDTNQMLEVTSLNNFTIENDIPLSAHIYWYEDSIRTVSSYLDDLKDLDEQEKVLLDAYEKFSNGTANNDDLSVLITELQLKPTSDYTYNKSTGVYTITSNGQTAIERGCNRLSNAQATRVNSIVARYVGEYWLPIGEDGSIDSFSINWLPDNKRASSSVKVVVEYGPIVEDDEGNKIINKNSEFYTRIISEPIEFKNLSWVPDVATVDSTRLTITTDDGSGGHYPIYNATDNRILDRREVAVDRTLKVDLVSIYDGESYLNGHETIIWKIPKVRTMIDTNGFRDENALLKGDEDYFVKYNYILDNYDQNYYYIKQSLKSSNPSYVQTYRINEYYSQEFTNNTVFCYLIKNNQIIPGSFTMTFSQHGSNGTDYTFALGFGELIKSPNTLTFNSNNNITYHNDEWEIIGPADVALTIGEAGFRRIKFDLYNSKNEIIELTNTQKDGIIRPWVENKTGGFYSGLQRNGTARENAKNLQYIVKQTTETRNGANHTYYTDVAVRVNPSVKIEKCRYIVFAASVSTGGVTSTYNETEYELGKVKFTQFLPVHVRTSSTYALSGPDYITYDDKGANPTTYNDDYDLLDITNNNSVGSFDISIDENAWDNGEYRYYPRLDEKKIVPSSLFIQDLDKRVSLDVTVGGNLTYVCPIVIIQNRYQMPGINSWNGDLLVDEENNRILASMLGAGKKNSDNSFSGVVMGEVGKVTDKNKEQTDIGLWGYNQGAQSFGFDIDGTAFIGKSSTGRINFDGNKGYIQSANYNNTTSGTSTKEGTRIDLDDGSIDMWGQGHSWSYDEISKKWKASTEANYSTNIHLDTVGSSSKPYFRIQVPKYTTTNSEGSVSSTKTTNQQNLILINKDNFYLQTADYDTSIKTGLKIDLKNGTFDSKGKLTINGALGSSINFGDTKNTIKLGIDTRGQSYLLMSSVGITQDEYNSLINGEYRTVYNRVKNHRFFNNSAFSSYIRKYYSSSRTSDWWIASWDTDYSTNWKKISNWKEGSFWIWLRDSNNTNNSQSYDKKKVIAYLKEGINQYLIDKNPNNSEAIETELKQLIKDVTFLYDSYEDIQNYVNNKTTNSVSIKNYGSKPLEINNNFWVNNKGELYASGGYISDLYLDNLNFYGYKDSNGIYHSGATNIRPKWMTFVTDISGTVHRSTVKISASIYQEVEVPYVYENSFTYPVAQTVTSSGSFGSADFLSDVGTGSNMSIGYSHVVDHGEDGLRYYYDVTVTDVVSSYATGTKEIRDSVTVPYAATWSGTSSAPYVDEIELKVTKISMWALTNNSTSTSTVTIS